MHKSEAEKIDSILDEHQQIYRRHNRIDNILAYCACIAWIPCIIAAFGVDGIYLKILFEPPRESWRLNFLRKR